MYITNMNKTKKIALSGIIVALYVVLMYFTASFSFGAIQVRLATSLYALSYVFPFLVLPLAIANMLSNILGGYVLDIVGGFFVGLITSGSICLARRIPSKYGAFLIIPSIILLPAFIVPIWLSFVLNVPYFALVISLCLGQTLPAVLGYFIVLILSSRVIKNKIYKPISTKKIKKIELSDSNVVEDTDKLMKNYKTNERVFEEDEEITSENKELL